jgi:hypothetical protein
LQAFPSKEKEIHRVAKEAQKELQAAKKPPVEVKPPAKGTKRKRVVRYVWLGLQPTIPHRE